MGSGEPFHVVDADTMQEIYKIDGLISKGSPVISTAYATEENGHQVYIYMVPYDCTKESNFWIISDKEGQTEPIYETNDRRKQLLLSNGCNSIKRISCLVSG